VAFLLNYLGADAESKILDPFCGSGTTLVESAIHGVESVGIDINPLAIFISTTKLSALRTPADEIRIALMKVLESFGDSLRYEQIALLEPDDRQTYLAAWFAPDVLSTLEALRKSIMEYAGEAKRILLALLSDLLRDYSLQEPTDLRIRRRISPIPTTPLTEAFAVKAKKFIKTLAASQEVVGLIEGNSRAFVGDSKNPKAVIDYLSRVPADFIITSPPYATALPYIDTQRLSLVWLELCSVADIRRLEGDAVGNDGSQSPTGKSGLRKTPMHFRQVLLSFAVS
jgi:site-specific DNA-methyltransferase (cytosine-N4-specific)